MGFGTTSGWALTSVVLGLIIEVVYFFIINHIRVAHEAQIIFLLIVSRSHSHTLLGRSGFNTLAARFRRLGLYLAWRLRAEGVKANKISGCDRAVGSGLGVHRCMACMLAAAAYTPVRCSRGWYGSSVVNGWWCKLPRVLPVGYGSPKLG